jgi:hypothetical protein
MGTAQQCPLGGVRSQGLARVSPDSRFASSHPFPFMHSPYLCKRTRFGVTFFACSRQTSLSFLKSRGVPLAVGHVHICVKSTLGFSGFASCFESPELHATANNANKTTRYLMGW